jgi:hypothetical protein
MDNVMFTVAITVVIGLVLFGILRLALRFISQRKSR